MTCYYGATFILNDTIYNCCTKAGTPWSECKRFDESAWEWKEAEADIGERSLVASVPYNSTHQLMLGGSAHVRTLEGLVVSALVLLS